VSVRGVFPGASEGSTEAILVFTCPTEGMTAATIKRIEGRSLFIAR
jgi:hypothetical protein